MRTIKKSWLWSLILRYYFSFFLCVCLRTYKTYSNVKFYHVEKHSYSKTFLFQSFATFFYCFFPLISISLGRLSLKLITLIALPREIFTLLLCNTPENEYKKLDEKVNWSRAFNLWIVFIRHHLKTGFWAIFASF